MPAIAWLALQRPNPALFPWWTGCMLDAMIVVGCVMIAVMAYAIGSDLLQEAREWRSRRRGGRP